MDCVCWAVHCANLNMNVLQQNNSYNIFLNNQQLPTASLSIFWASSGSFYTQSLPWKCSQFESLSRQIVWVWVWFRNKMIAAVPLGFNMSYYLQIVAVDSWRGNKGDEFTLAEMWAGHWISWTCSVRQVHLSDGRRGGISWILWPTGLWRLDHWRCLMRQWMYFWKIEELKAWGTGTGEEHGTVVQR